MRLFWLVLGAAIALAAVALLRSRANVPALPPDRADLPPPEDVDLEIVELVRAGRRVEAMKLYCDRYSTNLTEARRAIDEIDALD